MVNNEVISVSQYLDNINSVLKGQSARVLGEVNGVQMYEGRSYLFFSIKDPNDQSVARCFMWKRDFALCGVELKDGLEVIINTYPEIHKQYGFALQVKTIELVGEGALQIAYDKLKKKLESEGLFSLDKKREIPTYPHKIGVITSKSGAVINDFLTNIGKFGYEIMFVDSKVEGQEAIKDLLSAVNTLKSKNIDVLVLMRGGGSLESFQAFNNEVLVRAVADFPVPVITGIGHDKDAPLVSLVSDKNVSTPTAVANLLNSSWNDALAIVRISEQKIFSKYQDELRKKMSFIEKSSFTIESKFKSFIDLWKKAEQTMQIAVERIGGAIKARIEDIEKYGKDISREMTVMISKGKESIKNIEKTIQISSPENQLKRGYSIIRNKGRVIKSVRDAKKGDELDITVSDGIIHSQTI